MGFLDALPADAYPRDSLGRIVIAPYGRRGKAFIVPPERAIQIRRFQRQYFLAYFVALVIAGLTFGPWALWVVAALWMVGFFAGIAYVTHGLEEASERPTLSREERVNRTVQAMGRPTMYVICVGGASFALGGGWLLQRGQRSIAIWFITMYGLLVAALYASKLLRSRTALRQPNEEL